MGVLMRRWEQSQEGLGQVWLGRRQEPWARCGSRQVALGGSGEALVRCQRTMPFGMPIRLSWGQTG